MVRLPLLALMIGPRAPLPCWPPADRLLRLLLLWSSAAACCELLPLTGLLLLPAGVKRTKTQARLQCNCFGASLGRSTTDHKHNSEVAVFSAMTNSKDDQLLWACQDHPQFSTPAAAAAAGVSLPASHLS